MSDQIVITEKMQPGARYGPVLPAEGHMFDLVEPEEVEVHRLDHGRITPSAPLRARVRRHLQRPPPARARA